MNFKKIGFYLLAIIALLILGFYRDFLFKNMNALLQAWDNDMDYSMPISLHFFENLEYTTIMNLKWVFTLVFSLFYLLVSFITIKYMFQNKKYLRLTFGAYLILISISSVFIFIGMAFENTSDKMYEFAHYLMGITQSPILLMILIPVFKLFEKENIKS